MPFSEFGTVNENYVLSKRGTPDYTGVNLHTSAQCIPIPLMWGTRKISPNLIWQAATPFVPPGGALLGVTFLALAPDAGGNGYTRDADEPLFPGDNAALPPGAWQGAVFVDDASFHNVQYGQPDANNSDSRWWIAMISALCEGPINSISRVWNGGGSSPMSVDWVGGVAPPGPTYDNTIKPPSLFYTLFLGTSTQTPWGYFAAEDALLGGPYFTNQDLAYRFTAYIASPITDCGHGGTPPQLAFAR